MANKIDITEDQLRETTEFLRTMNTRPGVGGFISRRWDNLIDGHAASEITPYTGGDVNLSYFQMSFNEHNEKAGTGRAPISENGVWNQESLAAYQEARAEYNKNGIRDDQRAAIADLIKEQSQSEGKLSPFSLQSLKEGAENLLEWAKGGANGDYTHAQSVRTTRQLQIAYNAEHTIALVNGNPTYDSPDFKPLRTDGQMDAPTVAAIAEVTEEYKRKLAAAGKGATAPDAPGSEGALGEIGAAAGAAAEAARAAAAALARAAQEKAKALLRQIQIAPPAHGAELTAPAPQPAPAPAEAPPAPQPAPAPAEAPPVPAPQPAPAPAEAPPAPSPQPAPAPTEAPPVPAPQPTPAPAEARPAPATQPEVTQDNKPLTAAQIRVAQIDLAAAGFGENYKKFGADGKDGAATEKDAAAYAKKNGLSYHGHLDQAMLNALESGRDASHMSIEQAQAAADKVFPRTSEHAQAASGLARRNAAAPVVTVPSSPADGANADYRPDIIEAASILAQDAKGKLSMGMTEDARRDLIAATTEYNYLKDHPGPIGKAGAAELTTEINEALSKFRQTADAGTTIQTPPPVTPRADSPPQIERG